MSKPSGTLQRILVVSRSTSGCKEAVRTGVVLARKFGSELFLLHVIHNPFGIEGWNLPLPSLEKDYRQLLENTRKEMSQLVAAERAEGLKVTEMIREGDPEDEVVATVRENAIDLLIMLAHEEGRLEHFLFGRSNDELVRRLPCSLLLVKQEPGPVSWPKD